MYVPVCMYLFVRVCMYVCMFMYVYVHKRLANSIMHILLAKSNITQKCLNNNNNNKLINY